MFVWIVLNPWETHKSCIVVMWVAFPERAQLLEWPPILLTASGLGRKDVGKGASGGQVDCWCVPIVGSTGSLLISGTAASSASSSSLVVPRTTDQMMMGPKSSLSLARTTELFSSSEPTNQRTWSTPSFVRPGTTCQRRRSRGRARAQLEFGRRTRTKKCPRGRSLRLDEDVLPP